MPMPKSPNQKLKLLYLMKILLEKTDEEHPMPLAELLEQLALFGVKAERKSIYDDMEALRLYGLDVELSSGRAKGYYIANRVFELPELKLLVDAVQSSRFNTHKKSNELIKKVESFASVHEAKTLQRQVYVSNRIKTMNESIYYNVDKIHAAISENKQIRFRYFEWAVDFQGTEKVKKHYRREGAEYHISPWALTWDDENYYMIGFDSQADMIKHYRVDKMERITVSERERDGQEHFSSFDMAVYSKKMFSMFGGKEEEVTLRFSNRLIGVVTDRFGKDVFLTKEDEEHFRVRIRVAVSPQFLSWVFGFGTEVKILSPQSVADQFCRQAEEQISQYR